MIFWVSVFVRRIDLKVDRKTIASLGIFAMVFCGMISAWGTFSMYISRDYPLWSASRIAFTYTLTMFMFCIGNASSGYLNKKISPRVFMYLSAACFAFGLILTAKMQTLSALYTGFGIFCGFASGFAYNPIFSTAGKWFPDKPGFISGILLLGYGLGSFAVGKVFQIVTGLRGGDWRGTFVGLAILTLIAFSAAGKFIVEPNDYAVSNDPGRSIKSHIDYKGVEAEPSTMLRSSSFWYYFFWVVIHSALGFAIASQSSAMIRETNALVSDSAVATIIGLISVAKCIVRAFVGDMYDKRGRSITMHAVNYVLLLSCIVFIIALKSGNMLLLIMGFFISGLSFGGVTPTNSVFIRTYFGEKHFSRNFSFIHMNLLISSFGSTLGGMLFDATQTYMSIYILMFVGAVLSELCTRMIDRNDKKEI